MRYTSWLSRKLQSNIQMHKNSSLKTAAQQMYCVDTEWEQYCTRYFIAWLSLTSMRKFFFFFAAGDVSGGTRPFVMAATSSWRLRCTRCAVCTILVRGVRRYGLATISDSVSVHSSSSVWQRHNTDINMFMHCYCHKL